MDKPYEKIAKNLIDISSNKPFGTPAQDLLDTGQITNWNKNALEYGKSLIDFDSNIDPNNLNFKVENPQLFKWEEFTSHAGKQLKFKIECDAITPSEWDCLARMVVEYQDRPFSHAEGIPRGGIPFANALNKYASGNKDDHPLICDDVWTTGKSFKDYMKEKYPMALAGWGHRWVVFRRGPMENLNTCNALFTLHGA